VNDLSGVLEALDSDQRAICEIIEGPVAVIAGPGSGKTRVLTHRIAYMISQGLRDREILAITFTNKAAEEMKSRLRDLLKGEAKPFVATFHATGAFFLRQTADAFGLTRDFSIYDEDEARAVIKSIRADFRQKHLARLSDEGIANLIERAKRAGHLPGDLPVEDDFDKEFKEFYAEYQAGLRARNAADFADLILYPLRLFEEHPDRMAPFTRRFRFILVDEFQDIDASQYQLIHCLAKEHRNVFVVGDQDQSIYGFRGANPEFLERFVRDFPEARVMYLERNYRSHPGIVKAATEIARQSPFAFHKTLRSVFDEQASPNTASITLVETADSEVQSEEIARQIQRLISAKVPASEIAVLYRAHHLSAPIEYALAARRIPYRVVRGLRFLERKVVKDAISFLRILVNPQDIAAWERICTRPPRGIGEKTMAQIASLIAREKVDPLASADAAAPFPRPFQTLCAIIRDAFQKHQNDLPALLNALLRDSGYIKWLEEQKGLEDALAHLEGLEKLLHRATDEHKSLAQFLQDLALWSDQDVEDPGNRVQLMTLHAAKGLEFRVVLMPDLIEEILPHKRALESGFGLDEERRLFYVGITRARESVFLYRPFFQTSVAHRRKRTTPSRYLNALPADLLSRRFVPL
jgi:DNA helicase-2/ATP-dependent DNA helicase PcrA